MKYTFQLGDGREAVVRFKHHGKRKGKAPKSTRCRIMVGEDIISEAWARPAAEIATIIGDGRIAMPSDAKLLRIIKTIDGRKIAIYRGDQFCRREGRTESFNKAASLLSADDWRTAAQQMIAQGAVRSSITRLNGKKAFKTNVGA